MTRSRSLLCNDPAVEDERAELCKLFTSAIVCADGEDGAREAPKTIMLVPAAGRDGLVKARDGRVFDVDREALIKAAQDHGADLMIDRDHNSIFSFSPVPAAGWILSDTVRKKGSGKNAAIVADVLWTDAGRADVEGLLYRYVSPAFDPRSLVVEQRGSTEIMKVSALLNAGIVNQPALRMPALAAKQEFGIMDRKAICKALGIPEDSIDETILTACAALVDARDNPPAPVAGTGIPVAEYTALATTLADVQAQLTAITATNADKSSADLVAAALREERILPAEVETMTALAKKDPAMFTTIVEARVPGMFSGTTTAVTVPVVPPVTAAGGTVGTSGLDKNELHICKMLGQAPAEYLKQKIADAQKLADRVALGLVPEAS